MWRKILGQRGGTCGVRLIVRQASTDLSCPYSLTSCGLRPHFAKKRTQQDGSDSPGSQANQNHYGVNPGHGDGSFLTLWLLARKGILRYILYHRGKITELKRGAIGKGSLENTQQGADGSSFATQKSIEGWRYHPEKR